MGWASLELGKLFDIVEVVVSSIVQEFFIEDIVLFVRIELDKSLAV